MKRVLLETLLTALRDGTKSVVFVGSAKETRAQVLFSGEHGSSLDKVYREPPCLCDWMPSSDHTSTKAPIAAGVFPSASSAEVSLVHIPRRRKSGETCFSDRCVVCHTADILSFRLGTIWVGRALHATEDPHTKSTHTRFLFAPPSTVRRLHRALLWNQSVAKHSAHATEDHQPSDDLFTPVGTRPRLLMYAQ